MSASSPPRWLDTYEPGVPTTLGPRSDTVVAVWAGRVADRPEGPALIYFDHTMSASWVDRSTDALAAALADRGVRHGDRVGIYLQNVPQFPLAMLALWKLGAAALLLNPMYRRDELRHIVDDAGAVGILCDVETAAETRQTLTGGSVQWLISTSGHDLQSRDDPRVLAQRRAFPPDGVDDLMTLMARFDGQRPPRVEVSADDLAILAYTSGTTGPPKGAMCTHRSVLHVAHSYGRWTGVDASGVVLALAPLFHITGAVANAVLALVQGAPLVLAGRFEPGVVLDAITEHQVTSTTGAITAFTALGRLPEATSERLSSFTGLFSGGAPIPPTTVSRFLESFDQYIHNAYGMTETSSAVIAVPRGATAPVHEPSGTLSIGVPLPDARVRVVDAAGVEVAPGEQGELEIAGPQVMDGYWGKPEESALATPGGRLRTGDVAIMDQGGWVYLVDRLKDQINVSGYKVWPREVEDALYEHPAVREVAVVSRPDEYQGESVVAFVSTDRDVEPDELRAWARERLAAYKTPREVHVVSDLPKTQTGKIRRAALREQTHQEP